VRVHVSAPAHVHVGNIDIHGGLGRLYGTVGFTLEEPRLRVTVERAERVEVVGSRRREFEHYARLYAGMYGVPLRVTVHSEIPAMVGLGSTTPIALSIGYAAALLAGAGDPRMEEIALAGGRSTVSALGFYAFTAGGFIVDGGFRPGERMIPPLVFRREMPWSLRLVVAVPRVPKLRDIIGIKVREDEVLRSMPRMSEDMAAANARILAMGILPAAAEGDWEELGRWLTALNSGLGDFWGPRQEGRYCCREVARAVEEYLAAGALCACQSSWGPTVYALTREEALAPVRSVAESLVARYGGYMQVTRVDNVGARVRVEV